MATLTPWYDPDHYVYVRFQKRPVPKLSGMFWPAVAVILIGLKLAPYLPSAPTAWQLPSISRLWSSPVVGPMHVDYVWDAASPTQADAAVRGSMPLRDSLKALDAKLHVYALDSDSYKQAGLAKYAQEIGTPGALVTDQLGKPVSSGKLKAPTVEQIISQVKASRGVK